MPRPRLVLPESRRQAAPSALGSFRDARVLLHLALVIVCSALIEWMSNPFADRRPDIKKAIAILERDVAPGDLVYVSQGAGPIVRRYAPRTQGALHYGHSCTWGAPEDCLAELRRLRFPELPSPKAGFDVSSARIWLALLHNGGSIREPLAEWKRAGAFGRAGVATLWVSVPGLDVGALGLEVP